MKVCTITLSIALVAVGCLLFAGGEDIFPFVGKSAVTWIAALSIAGGIIVALIYWVLYERAPARLGGHTRS